MPVSRYKFTMTSMSRMFDYKSHLPTNKMLCLTLTPEPQVTSPPPSNTLYRPLLRKHLSFNIVITLY